MHEHGMRHREGVIARLHPFGGMVLAVLGTAAALLAAASPGAAAATCSNEPIRAEQGPAALALPDCRAYELVSPGSIPFVLANNQLGGGAGGGKASPDGNALYFASRYSAQESQRSSEAYLSRRTSGGWTITSLDPQITPQPTKNGECQPGVAVSENLDDFLFVAGGELADSVKPHIGECSKPVEELVAGEPRGYANLYLHRDGGPFVLANPVSAGATPGNATFQAASTDLSRIVFGESAKLTSDSPSGYNLFVWADGIVRLVGVLPNGEPVPAILGAATKDFNGTGEGNPVRGAAIGLAPVFHAVSADGERVFFQANGNLYLRKNAGQPAAADANCRTNGEPGLACTLRVDAPSFGKDPPGGGFFQFASRDGEHVFFSSDHALTEQSNALPGRAELYEYDVKTNKLTNVSFRPGGAASVLGISGGAEDGSRIYFVAESNLTGTQKNGRNEEAQAGQPNLYLAQHGQPLTYVATLGALIEPTNWWDPNNPQSQGNLTTAWSPSGRYLLFSSTKTLTEFANTPAAPGLCQGISTCAELYLYDSDTKAMSCVSCDPAGTKPIANTSGVARVEFERFVTGPAYLQRSVSDAGQVFFETANPLSPRDVNGVSDVYEYQAGNARLISSGVASGGSVFVDAGADRRDVFIITPETLVRADTDGGLPSIYDASVEGGFAEPPPPPELCHAAESCRLGGSVPPPSAPPATAAFAGPGNPKGQPCKRGRVRRGGHCAKKRKAHRRHRARKGRSN